MGVVILKLMRLYDPCRKMVSRQRRNTSTAPIATAIVSTSCATQFPPGSLLYAIFTSLDQEYRMAGRLHGLEAIRGIAALIVAYCHVGYLAETSAPAALLFQKAYLAVDLFFLLSGFVLARTYEATMPTPGHFVRVRFTRLWAPIACGVTITTAYLLVIGTAPSVLIPHMLAGLAILPVFGFLIICNPPAWSIFFELVANFLHAAGLKRTSVMGLAALIALCVATLVAGMGSKGLDVGQGESFWLGFPRVVMSYAAGVLLWRLNGDRTWLPTKAAWPIVLCYPLVIMSAAGIKSGPVEIAMVMIVHPLVLLAALSMRQSSSAIWLGALSFPLYALHFPLQRVLLACGFGWAGTLAFSLIAAGAIGTAVDPRWRRLVLQSLSVRARRVSTA